MSGFFMRLFVALNLIGYSLLGLLFFWHVDNYGRLPFYWAWGL